MDSSGTLLLTGSTGQLGSFVLANLLQTANSSFNGHVICSYRSSSSFKQLTLTADFLKIKPFEKDPRVHFVALDLEDAFHSKSLLEDYCTASRISMPNSIIHAAAQINLSPGAPPDSNNVSLTKEVFLLGEILQVEHITHVSSIATMGGTASLGEEEVLESHQFHPSRSKKYLSNYALSKMDSELEAWRAQSEEYSVSVVRPGVILGIGPLSAAPQELWLRLRKNRLPFATDGTSGVVDVRDAAKIVVATHQNRVQDPVVAVASTVSYYELLSILSLALDKEPNLRFLPAEPWLERMRSLSFLSKFPWIGKYFTAQMRIMLFSKTGYDGSTGASLIQGYSDWKESAFELGAFMRKLSQ